MTAPRENLEGSLHTIYTDYTHTDIPTKLPEEIEKLEYMYQHFQDHEKIYETDPQVTTEQTDDTLYPQINNDIEYGLFENVVDSYYLDSQMRDDFTCTKACYTHNTTAGTPDTNPQCTHTYDHISQQLHSLADTEQQQMLYTNEVDASLFTTDTSTQCTFSRTPSNLETKSEKGTNDTPQNNTGIHFYSKHKYRDTFGDTHIMTLIMVMHSFTKTNIQLCYNRSYKIPIGVYTIQSQPKVINPLTWTLRLCLTQCIFLVIPTQSPKSIMSHIKQYSTMIKECSQHN